MVSLTFLEAWRLRDKLRGEVLNPRAWLLGIAGTYTIGAFVHVLLVIALVLFVLGLLSGRRTVI